MNKLIFYLRISLYTPLLSFAVGIVALVISLRRKNTDAALRVFPAYFLSYLLIFLCLCALSLLNRTPYSYLLNIIPPLLDLLLTLIEFIVFMRFFSRVLTRPRQRTLLVLIGAVFGLAAFILVSRDLLFHHRLDQETLQVLFTIQAISLIVPCIAYFINIFTYTPVSSLRNEPHFWVVTGLSFMLVCTFPLSLFLNYIEEHESVLYRNSFAIFYIFYSLLFLMIIRAYLCNPTSSK